MECTEPLLFRMGRRWQPGVVRARVFALEHVIQGGNYWFEEAKSQLCCWPQRRSPQPGA